MLDLTLNLPQVQSLTLKDFTGGFTDWKCNCPPNFFTKVENIEVQDNKSLCSRYGSRVWKVGTPRVSSGARINHLDCLKGNILQFHGKKIGFCDEDGSLQDLEGPVSSDLLCEAVDSTCADSAIWNNHIYAVDDACSTPIKIYCDEFGNITVKQVGIPRMNLPPTVTSNTTPSVDPISGEDLDNNRYVYAFFYCCRYMSGDQEFIDFSEPVYVELEEAPDFDTLGEAVDITALQSFVNPIGKNYDENNIKIHVYRTVSGGTTFYKIGEIDNTQTTYNDGLPDSQLLLNEVIFNQDSEFEYDPAPPSKYIESTHDTMWYANSKVDGVQFENRLYQSIPGDPDTVPREFYVEFEGEINGLSTWGDNPIVSVITREGRCRIYRVNGRLDASGRDHLVPHLITETVAAIGNQVFVRAKSGLYFLGTDGVYVIDGHRAQKLSDKWNETYCKMTETARQRKNAYGVYDKYGSRILWGVTSERSKVENDKYLVFDERFGSFTWYSNGDCFSPSASIYKEKDLYRADSRGYMFIHDNTDLSDPNVDTSEPDVTKWETKHIPWCLRSIDLDAGSCDIVKNWSKISFRGKPETSSFFGVKTFKDGCDDAKDITGVRYEKSSGWCASGSGWCASERGWCVGENCYLRESRKFGCGNQKAVSQCIELCNYETVLKCSTQGDATTQVEFTPNTSRLCRTNGLSFNQDDVGRKIVINDVEYPIVSFDLASGCVSIDSSPGLLAPGSYDWEVIGFPKDQRFCITCVTLSFCSLSDFGGEYDASSDKSARSGSST